MEISRHLHSACSRLRYHNGKCLTVGVLLRTKDFATLFDKERLVKPTDFELTLQRVINKIIPKLYKEGIMYRSTGVVLEDFCGEQLSLFDEGDEKEKSLSKCIDNIEKKFGRNAIRTGF